jgi:aerobic-type carbon monoxide dehydrogenase small subunit (CoxS/CutS family)
MPRTIRFRLNGRPAALDTEDSRTLLWVLRTDLDLTGTKYGCGVGACGACTVIVEGKAVRSCQTSLKEVEGKEITTIEGLAKDGELHALQKAFIMTAYGLLLERPHPTRAAIAEGMEFNLCRCGAHARILAAIEDVAQAGARS